MVSCLVVNDAVTLGRCAHIGIADRMKALDALPKIEPTGPITAESAKATGTYAAGPVAPGVARRAHLPLTGDNTGEDSHVSPDTTKRLETPGRAVDREDLLLPANKASGGNRTLNIRFTKAVLYH